MLYFSHCPNSSRRYCVIDIKTLCKQSTLMFCFNSPTAAQLCLLLKKKWLQKLNCASICWLTVHHIWLWLTAQIRNNSWFSVALLQRQRKYCVANKYIMPYSITTISIFFFSVIWKKILRHEHLSLPGLSTTGWTSVKLFTVKTHLP